MRIEKVREYLFSILDEILESEDYKLNANFLDIEASNYSIDRIPVEPVVEKWINGDMRLREVYNLRSRTVYGQDVMDNLANIGFFEKLENKINSNNTKGIRPEGMEDIKCLNVGAMNIADTNTAEFSIQIQIEYMERK